jgi:hypothetical protein
MVDFSRLERKFQQYFTFKPYENVEKFPTVRNDRGESEQVSEGWREVEFKCITPNATIIQKIEDREQNIETVAFTIKAKKHLKEAMKYVSEDVIKGWNIEEGGVAKEYDAKWMNKHFFYIPWLYHVFVSEYRKSAGYIDSSKPKGGQGSEEDFLYDAEDTLIISSEDGEE